MPRRAADLGVEAGDAARLAVLVDDTIDAGAFAARDEDPAGDAARFVHRERVGHDETLLGSAAKRRPQLGADPHAVTALVEQPVGHHPLADQHVLVGPSLADRRARRPGAGVALVAPVRVGAPVAAGERQAGRFGLEVDLLAIGEDARRRRSAGALTPPARVLGVRGGRGDPGGGRRAGEDRGERAGRRPEEQVGERPTAEEVLDGGFQVLAGRQPRLDGVVADVVAVNVRVRQRHRCARRGVDAEPAERAITGGERVEVAEDGRRRPPDEGVLPVAAPVSRGALRTRAGGRTVDPPLDHVCGVPADLGGDRAAASVADRRLGRQLGAHVVLQAGSQRRLAHDELQADADRGDVGVLGTAARLGGGHFGERCSWGCGGVHRGSSVTRTGYRAGS